MTSVAATVIIPKIRTTSSALTSQRSRRTGAGSGSASSASSPPAERTGARLSIEDPLRPGAPSPALEITIAHDRPAERLDKALAAAAGDTSGLSRSRIAQLIAEGAVTDAQGRTVAEVRRRVKPGERFRLTPPEPAPARPEAEAIALSVVHEDRDLIVIDKPAGMVVHPAPGAEHGTLVNALLAHCGDGLSGIGGERRPGIVHRIDKDTSGLLVAAKTEAAMTGLAAQFAAHSIERLYAAVLRRAPDATDPRLRGLPGIAFEPDGWLRIAAAIARHPVDRKRMAVRPGIGRRAVTRLRIVERFGAADRPLASLATCRLETGRTHQIRVHAAHIGHALIGDSVYGRSGGGVAANLPPFGRQALHAATLGFVHPVSGRALRFEVPPPADFAVLVETLRRIGVDIR